MKQSRLDQLSDGIFAIVMTILVLEIRVPDIGLAGNNALVVALIKLCPVFLSYLLSFTLLFTYWRSHHYIASVYAHNLDIKITNINAFFFFFVALVPFTSHVLGTYSTLQTSVLLFAVNVIIIGLALYAMRSYAENSKTIEHEKVSKIENRHAYIRILFPVFCACVAIGVSFYTIPLALFLFTVGILFNLSTRSTKLIDRVLRLEK